MSVARLTLPTTISGLGYVKLVLKACRIRCILLKPAEKTELVKVVLVVLLKACRMSSAATELYALVLHPHRNYVTLIQSTIKIYVSQRCEIETVVSLLHRRNNLLGSDNRQVRWTVTGILGKGFRLILSHGRIVFVNLL